MSQACQHESAQHHYLKINMFVKLVSWLRGRDPVMSVAKFEARWQRQGVLYTVADGIGARLVLPGWETELGVGGAGGLQG